MVVVGLGEGDLDREIRLMSAWAERWPLDDVDRDVDRVVALSGRAAALTSARVRSASGSAGGACSSGVVAAKGFHMWMGEARHE